MVRMMTIDEIRSSLAPICAARNVERAYLFGSYARGTQDSHSDIDLLIVKPTNERFLDRFSEFADIYRALRGTAVDMLVYTPEELTRNAGRTFVRTIIREGVLVYEH